LSRGPASAVIVVLALSGCVLTSPPTPASPHPSPPAGNSVSPPASPSPAKLADWPQYHRNALHTGLGPALPAVGSPRRAWTVGVDGKVFASPLIVGGRVIVATENNTVFALDVVTGAVVWKRHLGTPVAAGTLPCGNISPVTGITGTPAADPVSGELFVVAFLSGYHHVLFTLSLADGSVTRSLAVDPSGSTPQVQQQRPALTLTDRFVYIAYGGLAGDCGPYHGYLVAVPRSGGSPVVYRTPTARESGFWTPMGVTVSESGDVYAVTGNGSASASLYYSNSVLHMSADLKLEGFFAPSDWRQLDAGDVDLGSVGVALLPQPGLLVAIGKDGVLYVLRAATLGGIGGQAASAHVCGGAWGGSAWMGGRVFLPCNDGLVAVDVSSGAASVAWRAAAVHTASPIVSAGAVWAIDVSTSTLFALDIESGAVLYSLGLGDSQHFSTPAATEGLVVAPAGSAVVAVAVAPAP
jgi:outer membrane protein assembly factor BamB